MRQVPFELGFVSEYFVCLLVRLLAIFFFGGGGGGGGELGLLIFNIAMRMFNGALCLQKNIYIYHASWIITI